MKRAIKNAGKITILLIFVVVMSLIVFSARPIETAYAATVIDTGLKFASASMYWYQNQKTSSGVYGGNDPIKSIPYASLKSNGTLNYHDGKYYTDTASLTAFYNGMSNNWIEYPYGETCGANWGKISINTESTETGRYCEHKVGNYGSQAYAEYIGKLEISCELEDGLNHVTFELQQGSTKGFWMKQDTATGVVDVIYDSTSPVITINGITNGYAINSDLKISASDTYLDKIALDGNVIKNNSSVSRSSLSDGEHTVVAVDYAGNVSAQSFTVDNTAPTISKSITSNYANNTFTVTTEDEHSTGLLYKTPTSTDWISVKNDTITINKTNGDGLYQFKGVDIVGLTSEVISITLDTIKPSLTGQSDGAYTNKPFTIKATDTNLSELYYKRPNEEFAKAEGSSYAIVAGSVNGTYEFYCLDKAENRFPESGSFKVNFDTVAPTLTGVTNGAFYKDKVVVKWDESVLFNSSDAITAQYSLSTSGAFPTSSAISFVSGTPLDAEGNYRISFCDKAGNEKIYNFSIDKQAPTLTLDGVNSKNFSKTSMKATWLKTVGGVGAQFMNSNDSITAKYAVSNSGTFPKAADKNYSSGSALTQEGNYLIVITDKAGNERSFQFTIDKTAPTLTLSGLVSGLSYHGSKSGFSANWVTTVGGVGSQRVNDNDVITVEYSRNSTTIFPTSTSTPYTRNTVLGNEGYYLLQIMDSAENKSEYCIVVDKTAPTISRISEYLNYGFDFEATDLHNATILYKFNDGQQRSDRSGKVTITCDKANYGIWEFYAEDELGNRSEKQSIHLFYRSDFGNLENAKNGYKVPTWFTVTLPSKIYTDIAGKYSFRTREDALSFAIAKEWEYRVEKLANGWSYVNIGNESVSQVYTDKAALDTAVLKYATTYVSERKEMQLGNNTYPNPTDKNGQIRADALTQQDLSYPGILSAYKDLPLYLMRHDFMFTQPEAGVVGNTRKAQIKYIATDFKTVSSSPITIDYGVAVEKLLTAKGAYKQGYYLVEESDLCGNYQSYVVYLDIDMPTLSAVSTSYSGEQSTIEFTNEYVTSNSGVMLYVTLELKSILDNIDDCVMLCVSGRGMDSKIFVAGDELPTLGLEHDYYGSYKISVYDRSLNDLTFNIRIAGEEPYLTHTSLTNETRCTFTINYDSSNNGITDVNIFKVSYLGEYTELHEDSNGTPISAATLQYVIKTGGKYVVRFTDIFGRVIESEPLFYMKGLPIGTLKGVKEGGITNRDVSFEYSDDSSVYLYAYIDKAWVRYDEVLTFVEKEGYTIASIAANADTSLMYKFFLYVSSDMNLFTEYRFEVDCIAPTAVAATVDGVEVSPETVTTSEFSVNWDEANITARYYNTKDALGQLSESVYQKNTVISRAGTYVFTVRDVVGNETVFSITLDNMVSYSIDGRYSMLEDGSYISKTDLTLTVTEHTSKFECTASNGATITNGATLTEDGTYVFEICDAYGNTLELTIIIDKLPPVPVILTQSNQMLEINGFTNESFTVSCEEPGVKTTIKNGNQYQSYSGDVLSEEGIYSFKIVDRMGNTITFTVTIDCSVDYRVNGTYLMLEDGSYISRLSLSISMREDYKSFTVTSNRPVTFLPNEKIDVEGVYEVTIVDGIGNVAVVKLIIDKTPPTPTIIAEDGSEVLHGKTNQPFIVTCAEQGSALRIATSASSNGNMYLGEQLSEKGIYYFRLTDLIGNELAFSVEIDLNVGFNVKGTYKIDKNGAYVSSSSLSIEITEEYSSFVVSVHETGLSILPGEAITQEGTYSVRIVDIAGNVQEICLIIDKTAPSFIIKSISGVTIEPNQIIKEGFVVRCDEDDAVIKVSTTGTKYAIYDGNFCTIDNIYYFIVEDFIGNEIEFIVEIDFGIDFIVRGNFIQDGNRYSSRSALTVEVKEDILNFDVQSSNGVSFKEGEQISVEGIYLVSITDFAGNTAIIEIIIDKTAPTPRVSATSGGLIEPNSTTRSPFVIMGEEGDTITYSTSNVAKYVPYDGAVLSEEKKYFFIMTDYVGNETSFYITLDMSVAYALKGTYVINDDGIIFSRSGISVQVSEPYETFTVNGAVNQSIIAGERITAEGEYFIQLEDVYGNTAALTIVIVMTAPKIVASVESGAASRESVYVSIEGATQAYYRNQSGDIINIDSSCVLSENGDYTIVAKDLVGNESIYKFTIDTFVEVDIKPLIVSGQVVTESMTFKFNEQVKSTLWFNGVETVYSSKISDHGEYRLRAEDEIGNVFDIEWTILEPIANFYEFDIPEGFDARLLADGTVIPIQNVVKLDKDGEYSIEFSREDYSYAIELTVDTVAPTVEITQKKNQISFSKADKDNVTYTLYLNGNEIKGSPNSTITECGKYTLVVTDELGNQTTYNFELNYINTFGIVVIVIGCVVILAILIGILVYRGRLSVK